MDSFLLQNPSYDINTSDADVALLVLCRGVLNTALAAYIRREKWLLGRGAFVFWVVVATLNAAAFVAMVSVARFGGWGGWGSGWRPSSRPR